MNQAFVCDAVRTPFGRYGGTLSSTQADDLAAIPLRSLMPETGENVAEQFQVSRQDQDAFAYRSQHRWSAAQKSGFFARETIAVQVPQKKGEAKIFSSDKHPRPDTTLDGLAKLRPVVKTNGTVTAGNASGINDGACARLLASGEAVKKYHLTPQRRALNHHGDQPTASLRCALRTLYYVHWCRARDRRYFGTLPTS
jgi:acetyl-CoA acetyltransferase